MSAQNFIVDQSGARAVSRDEATAALGTDAFIWVHFDECDTVTEDWLCGPGRLEPLVASALVATETRPRLELFDNGVLLNLRGLDADGASAPDLLSSIRLWGERYHVYSVSKRALGALALVEAQVAGGTITDPGDFVAALAVAITEGLDPDVAALGDRLDSCEESFEARRALAMRRTVGRVRSRAISYRRFVAPQRAALERLAALDADWLSADDKLHLGEAADRAARMAEELETIRERSALLHEQLTDLRSEMTETRGLVVSVVALIFLPLTFLTGLLGMNVAGIPFAEKAWSFWAVVALSFAIAVGTGGYFIRARWFR